MTARIEKGGRGRWDACPLSHFLFFSAEVSENGLAGRTEEMPSRVAKRPDVRGKGACKLHALGMMQGNDLTGLVCRISLVPKMVRRNETGKIREDPCIGTRGWGCKYL